jgi:ribonucleoside-diphosphate reductase alpha chain
VFLDRDYLLPGQTLDERVDIICASAEKILNKPGYGAKLKANIEKGWYSLSTPIWANFGNSRGLPISCVTGDTWINTLNGGKQAKDVAVGDMVLTHKNRFRKIINVIPTKNKSDIWKLKVGTRMTNLYITGNHPVLTNLGWVRVDELNPNIHLIAVNGELKYEEKDHVIDLKEYTNYQFIIKDNKICKSIETDNKKVLKRNLEKDHVTYYSKPNEYVEITEDLAWAIGLWFAEGSISTSKKKEPNGVRITLNAKDELQLADMWANIMENSFSLNSNLYKSSITRNNKNNSWLNVNVNSVIIGNLFKSFGNGCKEKEIPEWVLSLPKNKLNKFLEGILLGDGYNNKNGTCKITLANPKLILQLYNIGLKLGKDMSLQMQEKPSKLSTTKHVYTLIFRKYKTSINRNSCDSGIKFNDGLVYCPIKTLEKTEKIENVYDFTVEEDHSFSCNGIIVHNCFGSYIGDSMESILQTISEVGMMTKVGGGTSAYFGELRHRGAAIKDNGESSGAVHFMQPFDNLINIISQGKLRRGNFASYLPIEHKDIMEHLTIKSDGSPLQDISFGITVTDKWMEEMLAGDIDKRKVWAKVLQTRAEIGYPYIIFIDNMNNYTVDVYKDKSMKIYASNLCTEIGLPSSILESFVCDLGSLNILHYDEWKDTDAVEIFVYLLDAVCTDFINKAKDIPYLERAVRFAERHRAIGIGQLGWHSYLQSKMIPFESMEAKILNVAIAKNIKEKAYAASEKLAKEYGEPEVLKGYGRRNTTLLAIAPTKSSAFILGQVSENVEPQISNYYIKDLAKIKYTYKNPHLLKLLEEKGHNTMDVWNSILMKAGSVQHLDFLSDHEKKVFRTFIEITPMEIIIQASQRQKYIDQAQSLNLMIHPSIPIKDVNSLIIEAWKLGIKSLYYQLNVNAAQEFSRNILECSSCEA